MADQTSSRVGKEDLTTTTTDPAATSEQAVTSTSRTAEAGTTASAGAVSPPPADSEAPLAVVGGEEEEVAGPVVRDDTDSAYGEDWQSDTTSIRDTIRNYRTLHGRTFHNYGDTEYWGPNDDAANEQWDIGHQLYTLILDSKLFLAPIGDNPQKVLDVGTGTGIWAMDFADAYPSASVIGTDLSPIQPTWVPSNLKFEIDDAQLEWTYPNNTFDLVHLRILVGSIDDWGLLYSRAFNAIKPGGWIEHMDTDVRCRSDNGSLKPGDAMYDWGDIFIGAGEKMGRTFLIAERSKSLLEAAGFVDVVSVTVKAPIGPWMKDKKWKEIGNWYLLFLTQGLENLGMYMLIHVLGWQMPEVQVFLAKMRAQLLTKGIEGYCLVTTTYGRKPESA